MKTIISSIVIMVLFLCFSLTAQQADFDPGLYKNFLSQNKNLTGSQLLELYPAGTFRKEIKAGWDQALFHRAVDSVYTLSGDEKSLIRQHGFVVSQRLQKQSIGMHLLEIYHADLPVYISSDMILHAFHHSYNEILIMIEKQVLIPKVKELLKILHEYLPVMSGKYAAYPEIQVMLRDVDLYLTVPRKIFDPEVAAVFPSNADPVARYLNLIEAEQPASVNIFSETSRDVDFSQFKVRGHYEGNPDLSAYFKAMIWLGRMEIYLLPPRAVMIAPTFDDIRRQIIDACLIEELSVNTDAKLLYDEIEDMLSFFVGDQDNVTVDDIAALKTRTGIGLASDLIDSLAVVRFQDTLRIQPYAQQRILSQILMNDPMNPDSIVPASAFLLFGQRFVIDSYVTGNVVYDRVKAGKLRMLPSPLDILFSIGNDAAAQLLQSELIEYGYAPQLAGLRYLIDAYGSEFWESTLYNGWLNVIRTLNPPQTRDKLPGFMKTAAWWQKSMNTQLASWTELRHDNLLYAKQSYTGGVTCSYPFAYVEPVPEFFEALGDLCNAAIGRITVTEFPMPGFQEYLLDYLAGFRTTMDTLTVIASKELEQVYLSAEEEGFLHRMLSEERVGCTSIYNGWYPGLYFYNADGFLVSDQLVADYHTAPTDEFGNMIGWVAHAGTGPVDLAILVASRPDGTSMAFAGPVTGLYSYTTTNFTRLTDSEWQEIYLAEALRPDWVNLYSADKNGSALTSGPSLLTAIGREDEKLTVPGRSLLVQNYPNPFNNTTLIRFNLPAGAGQQRVRLTVYDISGRSVIDLLDGMLPAGNYLTRWNGTDKNNRPVASGIYLYRLQAGDEVINGKMQLIR
jgi:hypothetical protein